MKICSGLEWNEIKVPVPLHKYIYSYILLLRMSSHVKVRILSSSCQNCIPVTQNVQVINSSGFSLTEKTLSETSLKFMASLTSVLNTYVF